MDAKDVVGIAVLVLACQLAVVIPSFVFNFFIALKSKPDTRAAWTAGLSYVCGMLIIASIEMQISDVEPFYLVMFLLMPVAGGLITFWYWRRTYRRNWVDDVDQLSAEIALENDDWRTGVMRFAMVALAIVAILGFRVVARLFFG